MNRPVLEIDHSAIEQNYLHLRDLCPGDCAATVKADAYGLGVEAVSKTLRENGCTIFFVATMDEAIELRRTQPDVVIYVFAGIQSTEAEVFERWRIRPVLNDISQLEFWASAARPHGAALHIDTGMNRLGVSGSNDLQWLFGDKGHSTKDHLDLIMTHLAFADTPEHPTNEKQVQAFAGVSQFFPNCTTSIGNSAGVLNGKSFCGTLARPGIGLYGGNPWAELTNPMRNVVTLSAPILQLRDALPGETVGYGGAFRADSAMRLATVGIGYADGVPRCLSPEAVVHVGEVACPIIGRVSMDSMVIDVTNVPDRIIETVNHVELIGRTPLGEFAAWAGTISYEILTGIGRRVFRSHTNHSETPRVLPAPTTANSLQGLYSNLNKL